MLSCICNGLIMKLASLLMYLIDTTTQETNKMKTLGTHIDRTNGNYFFIGDVPEILAYVTKDGKTPTRKQFDAAHHVGPRIAGLTKRTFRTRKLAELALALVTKNE